MLIEVKIYMPLSKRAELGMKVRKNKKA